MLNWLRRNVEGIATLGVPFSFLAIDMLLRFFFGISLADAGADMALAASSCFAGFSLDRFGLALSAEDYGAKYAASVDLRLSVFITIGLGIVWLLCLGLLSDNNPLYSRWPMLLSGRQWLVWGIGIGAIIMASRLLWQFCEAGERGG